MDVQAREAAQAASRMFWDAVSGLPAAVGTRRTRKLAILWENAAAMTLWHHRSVYADAEQLGFTLLTQLPEMGVPRGRRWLEFRDANKHAEHLIDRELRSTGQRAAVMRAAEAFNSRREAGSEAALAAAVAAAAADPPVTDTDKTHPHKTTWPARRRRRTGPRDRGPIADQAELRWRIRADLSNLRLSTTAPGRGPHRRPDRAGSGTQVRALADRYADQLGRAAAGQRASADRRRVASTAPPLPSRPGMGRHHHRRPHPAPARNPPLEAATRRRTNTTSVRRTSLLSKPRLSRPLPNMSPVGGWDIACRQRAWALEPRSQFLKRESGCLDTLSSQ